MRITAEGYDAVAQYIRVAEPSANIAVELEKSEEETQEASSEKKDTTEKDTAEKDTDQEDDTDDDKEEGTTSKKYQSKLSDAEEEDTKDESSEEDEDSKDTVVSSKSKYKVYIDAPDGVEAYLDGSYIGITPISFNKVSGSYVVTLRKTGYQPRSYTLQIDDEEKDVNYSFTDLVKLED